MAVTGNQPRLAIPSHTGLLWKRAGWVQPGESSSTEPLQAICAELKAGSWSHWPHSGLLHYRFPLKTSSKVFSHLSEKDSSRASHHICEMKTNTQEQRWVWSSKYEVILKESEGLGFASLPCTQATLLRGKPQASPASSLVGEAWLLWAGHTRTAEGSGPRAHARGLSWFVEGRTVSKMTWAVAREWDDALGSIRKEAGWLRKDREACCITQMGWHKRKVIWTAKKAFSIVGKGLYH